MAYTYDPIFAKDPANPNVVARNAVITIFDPADATKAPIAITDPTGVPLPNPITVDAQGMGPAFQHPTLARVGWFGGGFTNYFTSYEGLRDEAVAARTAAETAGATAAAAASTALAGAVADADAAATAAAASATAAANAAALVGAPADSAIAAAINGTGTATKTALSATILAGGIDTASMAAWGSSSIAGTGATATTNLVGRLSTILGLPAYNGGNGGELVTHHAARSGAVPALVTIASGTIPASGAVDITVENFTGTRLDRLKPYTGTLQGVPGTIAYSGGTLRFTRTANGTAVRIPNRAPFIPDANQYAKRFTVLWPGKNTLVDLEGAGVAQVVEYTRRMDAQAGGFGSRNVILGHFVDTGVPSTHAEAVAIKAVNAQYAIDYGERYIDVQSFVTSPYVWYVSGISPTAQDLADQAAGYKPGSLSYDGLHFNEAGYNAIAMLVAMHVKALGWFPNASIPALPAEPTFPLILSNTSAPTISGSQATGSTLTATNGAWSATPDSYTYQWKRDGANISGATASTYVTQAADETKAVTLTVTAAKAGYVSGTANSSNSVTVYAPGTAFTLTSDSFSGDSANVVGRSTDVALGGTVATWQGSTASAAFQTQGGTLQRGASVSSQFLAVPAGAANQEVSVKITALPVTSNIYLSTRRQALATSDQYRLDIAAGSGGASGVSLRKFVSGADASLGISTTVAVGDTLALRAVGTTIGMYKNGVLVGEVTNAEVSGAGFAGFASSGGVTAFGFDDFTVKNFV